MQMALRSPLHDLCSLVSKVPLCPRPSVGGGGAAPRRTKSSEVHTKALTHFKRRAPNGARNGSITIQGTGCTGEGEIAGVQG